ncbi:uncharacterized protein LOC101177346 [Nomascus leucogenys]|uniref:uncharacterized protein LOC101177346 n=1 Tax=Nomascus leucogenys TaxID=61853 RepID=UPI00062ABAC4|nr:uncharacterized protein LOC101177346 [Nomascus leucogenys]
MTACSQQGSPGQKREEPRPPPNPASRPTPRDTRPSAAGTALNLFEGPLRASRAGDCGPDSCVPAVGATSCGKQGKTTSVRRSSCLSRFVGDQHLLRMITISNRDPKPSHQGVSRVTIALTLNLGLRHFPAGCVNVRDPQLQAAVSWRNGTTATGWGSAVGAGTGPFRVHRAGAGSALGTCTGASLLGAARLPESRRLLPAVPAPAEGCWWWCWGRSALNPWDRKGRYQKRFIAFSWSGQFGPFEGGTAATPTRMFFACLLTAGVSCFVSLFHCFLFFALKKSITIQQLPIYFNLLLIV